MKKITSIFLVLVLIFSFVGCSSTAKEETATTIISEELQKEMQVAEVVQWTMANVMSKNSASRFVKASIYDEVKTEVENYKNSLPFPVEIILDKPSIADDFFEIKIIF